MRDKIWMVADILLNIFICVWQNKKMYAGLEQPEGE